MKKILFFISYIVAAISASAMEVVLTPGRLPEIMPSIQESADGVLVLKGAATSADLTALRYLPLSVSSLDLSGLEIKGCEQHKGDWFGQTVFSDGEIPAYMLMGTGVKTLRLPSAVTVIGKGAFSSTPLTEIDVAGVREIGEGAFKDCSELKKAVFLKSSFKSIPAYTFYGCKSLRDLSIASEVERVGKHALEKCGVRKIDLPWVKEIEDYAFARASDLTEIGFAYDCKLGEGAFYGVTSLDSVMRHPGNTPPLAFAGGASVDFLNVKGEEVGEGAYSNSKASLIGLSKDMKHIGPYAFHAMPNLKKIVAATCDEIPEAAETAFAGNNVSEISLYVKRGEVDKWRQAPVWRDFRITDEESGIIETAVTSDIEILHNGDMISVASSDTISDIALFSLDGMLLSAVNPEACSAEIAYPADTDIVIVRVRAGKGIKVVKLK